MQTWPDLLSCWRRLSA
uniref:Uncharacterized protein n=1 Tax=Arundo donax TaxID=35708 RepID=A0A0A9EPJ4_ARUDO